MSYRAAIALGSNLGQRLATLRSAVAGIATLGDIRRVSSLYETEPVGGPEQDPYLNAVVVLETDLSPSELLKRLQQLEHDHGRVRIERWGPRTLDLDLVTVTGEDGMVTLPGPELELPHPRAAERRFVLEPLSEVWPTAPLGDGLEAADALTEVQDQDVERLDRNWVPERPMRAYLFVGVQVLLIVLYFWVVWSTGSVPDPGNPATWFGSLLSAAGVALTGWAAGSLGPALSPYPEPTARTELVISGPYRWMRHPIYSGLVLAALGLAWAAGSWWAAAIAALIGSFFAVKARYEESRLRLALAAYRRYQSRVRGRLIHLPNGPG